MTYCPLEAAIARVEDFATIHESAFYATGARVWSTDESMALVRRPTAAVFAADHGFLIADIIDSEAEILTFAVASHRQNCGVGRGLLAEAMSWMRIRKVERCILEVAADNGAAIALYRSMGFRDISTRARYFLGPNGPIDAHVFLNLLESKSP